MCELDRLVRIQGDRIKPPAACEPLAGSSVSGIEKQEGIGRSLEWVVAGS